MTRYAKQTYHDTEGYFLDQMNTLTASQMLVQNYYAYADKYLTKVDGKVNSGEKWRVMLKWSTKISNACLEDEEKILSAMRKMNTAA